MSGRKKADGGSEEALFWQWLERTAETVTPAGVEGGPPPGQAGTGESDGKELYNARYGSTNGQSDRQDV